MSFDKFISNVRAGVAKRFDLKTDAEIDAFFIGLEESVKDNQEGLEKRDRMLRDTVAELCEAKRLLKAAISEMSSADVQPVVRCKDCKHRKERHYEESGEKPYIKYECKFTKYSMSDDGFCSFGARMDGDTCD